MQLDKLCEKVVFGC